MVLAGNGSAGSGMSGRQYYGFKFKSFKKNVITTVQFTQLYETMSNFVGTTSLLWGAPPPKFWTPMLENGLKYMPRNKDFCYDFTPRNADFFVEKYIRNFYTLKFSSSFVCNLAISWPISMGLGMLESSWCPPSKNIPNMAIFHPKKRSILKTCAF